VQVPEQSPEISDPVIYNARLPDYTSFMSHHFYCDGYHIQNMSFDQHNRIRGPNRCTLWHTGRARTNDAGTPAIHNLSVAYQSLSTSLLSPNSHLTKHLLSTPWRKEKFLAFTLVRLLLVLTCKSSVENAFERANS
jgi:hypothetical protein